MRTSVPGVTYREARRYASGITQVNQTVNAGTNLDLLDFIGRGVLTGFLYRTGLIVAADLGTQILSIYIDDNVTPKITLNIMNLKWMLGGAALTPGRISSVWVCTEYDATNNIYGFSLMARMSFDARVRINYANGHVTQAATLFSSATYDREV